jgi:tRNA1(Val) A37 N6-methylase TrmN6
MGSGPDQIEQNRGDLEPELAPGETLDAICRGELRLIQRRQGYRFSIDPILLAAFAANPRGKRAVDLGTGCGIMALLLARRGASQVIGVELQAALVQLALRNARLNRCDDRVQVAHVDLRALREALPAGAFDLVVSNPPYVAARAGNINPEPEKAVARHEICCSLSDVAHAARYLLSDGGTLSVVFPAARLVDLLGAISATGLVPRRMRLVHTIANRPARLVLVEAVKGGQVGLEAEPPLVLQDENGHYTPEADEILSAAGPMLESNPAALRS